jgi:hypothetical protein
METDSKALTILKESGDPSVAILPRLIADAHPTARFAWDEFFGGMIRNRNTRDAYVRAVRQFLTWTATQESSLDLRRQPAHQETTPGGNPRFLRRARQPSRDHSEPRGYGPRRALRKRGRQDARDNPGAGARCSNQLTRRRQSAAAIRRLSRR